MRIKMKSVFFCDMIKDTILTGSFEMHKKERKKTSFLYRVIIVILVGIIGFSLYKIGGILLEYHQGTETYEKLQTLAGAEEEPEYVDFNALLAENEDVKAWLYSEGTVINYPVVQGDDNEYYLYHMVNGEWNGKGSIFIDYRCENPFEDFNTILYGHRMKDGSMFHSLIEYEDPEYFEAHRTLRLILPEESYDIEVFSVMTIPADSGLYQYDFSGKDEIEDYLSRITEESLIDTGVEVSAEDRIVMMSTCTYEFEQARFVVYGRISQRQKS